jgi:TPR repeat protein
MTHAIKAGLVALALLLGLSASVASGPSEDAAIAFSRGDYGTEFRLLRPLADRGDALAQIRLGRMYEHGEGVSQDYAEAARWFREAANQGYVFAQICLGEMYEKGWGVPQDYEQAHMWFNLAASAGGTNRDWAVENRDRVARKMTPAQIAEAQRHAREWKPK